MKIIKRNKTNEVKFNFPDDAVIKREKDKLGKGVIHIANYPPARVEGKTRYLGGTYICDQAFVEDCDIIEDVLDVPADMNTTDSDTKEIKKYTYDKETKIFKEISQEAAVK